MVRTTSSRRKHYYTPQKIGWTDLIPARESMDCLAVEGQAKNFKIITRGRSTASVENVLGSTYLGKID